MRNYYLLFLLPLLASACYTSRTAAPPDWQLVWSDEFDYTGLPDSARWTYDVGGWGWGNNELQHYTRDRLANARVENGRLVIEAHREPYEEKEYTSARLITRGKQIWNRGKIVVRAKLPSGRGTWPAIWMLGEDIRTRGWPECGEIDIMEHVGYEPDTIFGTVHTEAYNHAIGTHESEGIAVPDCETAFHDYGIVWTEDRIDFLFDDTVYHSFPKEPETTHAEWPFDTPHYLLLNIAVGGNWGGARGVDTTIWPQRMEVDWVRVWTHPLAPSLQKGRGSGGWVRD